MRNKIMPDRSIGRTSAFEVDNEGSNPSLAVISRSCVWAPSRTKFKQIISSHKNLAEVIRYFGLVGGGSAYRIIKERIKEEGIYANHSRRSHGRIPLYKVLIKNSPHTNMKSLAGRLITTGILENKCTVCGISDWNGKKLNLILQCINRVRRDYRLENLKLVCPNCDSQLKPRFYKPLPFNIKDTDKILERQRQNGRDG